MGTSSPGRLPLLVCVLVCLCAAEQGAVNPACVAQCAAMDWKHQICALDGTTTYPGMNTSRVLYSCYFNCGLQALYPGACGCPNDCYNRTQQGVCANGTCACAAGWTGPDCSALDCAANNCSGNGVCLPATPAFPSARCQCAPGWTSYNCGTKVAYLPPLPYGDLFPNEQYYFDDKYGDFHPLFNASAMGAMQLSMDPADLLTLLTPANYANNTFMRANLTINLGGITQYYQNVGVRLKGDGSRKMQKKNFKISFNKFQPTRKFLGLTSFTLKGGTQDPTMMKTFLLSDSLRALNVPIGRIGFTSLWINGIRSGLYVVYEDVNRGFLRSRFGNDTGNLYKIECASLEYWGSSPAVYINRTALGRNCYELHRGTNASFIDLTQFIVGLNQSFALGRTFIDINRFSRYLAVEDAAVNEDSITWHGKNYYLYNNPATRLFSFIPHDLDLAMPSLTKLAIYRASNIAVYDWANDAVAERGVPTPLSQGVFGSADTKQMFTNAFWFLVNNSANPDIALYRAANVTVLFLPELVQDNYYPLDYQRSAKEFVTYFVPMMLTFMDMRRNVAINQLDPYIVVNVVTGSGNSPIPAPPANSPGTEDNGRTMWLLLGFGGGIAILAAIAAVFVWRRRRSDDQYLKLRDEEIRAYLSMGNATRLSIVDDSSSR